MTALPQPQCNDDDEQMLPIDAEIIGKLTGYEPPVISTEHIKRIRRMAKRIHTGCIVLEIVDDKLICIDQMQKYIIDPAEK